MAPTENIRNGVARILTAAAPETPPIAARPFMPALAINGEYTIHENETITQ